MIASYKDEDTERFAMGARVRRFVPFERVALRKIRQLQVCASLDDLRVPPGNRLEALKGDRAGQYSIRVNERYRVETGDGLECRNRRLSQVMGLRPICRRR